MLLCLPITLSYQTFVVQDAAVLAYYTMPYQALVVQDAAVLAYYTIPYTVV